MNTSSLLDTVASVALVDRGRVQPGTALADLGWDSLTDVSLIVELEVGRGLLVQPADLASCRTVDDVLAVVRAAGPTVDAAP
jgi:acyl carrier protein